MFFCILFQKQAFDEHTKKHRAVLRTALCPVIKLCGERGIRTPGGVTLNGFQDRRNRPLCHLSKMSVDAKLWLSFPFALRLRSAKLMLFFGSAKFFHPFIAFFYHSNDRLSPIL